MLDYKKKVLRAIIEWIDKTREDVNTWIFDNDVVIVPGFNSAFEVWKQRRLSGHWPLGDWLKQPLSLLAKVEAIDMVYWTWQEFRYNEDEKQERPRGLQALNATQREIVRVFDNG